MNVKYWSQQTEDMIKLSITAEGSAFDLGYDIALKFRPFHNLMTQFKREIERIWACWIIDRCIHTRELLELFLLNEQLFTLGFFPSS